MGGADHALTIVAHSVCGSGLDHLAEVQLIAIGVGQVRQLDRAIVHDRAPVAVVKGHTALLKLPDDPLNWLRHVQTDLDRPWGPWTGGEAPRWMKAEHLALAGVDHCEMISGLVRDLEPQRLGVKAHGTRQIGHEDRRAAAVDELLSGDFGGRGCPLSRGILPNHRLDPRRFARI